MPQPCAISFLYMFLFFGFNLHMWFNEYIDSNKANRFYCILSFLCLIYDTLAQFLPHLDVSPSSSSNIMVSISKLLHLYKKYPNLFISILGTNEYFYTLCFPNVKIVAFYKKFPNLFVTFLRLLNIFTRYQ